MVNLKVLIDDYAFYHSKTGQKAKLSSMNELVDMHKLKGDRDG